MRTPLTIFALGLGACLALGLMMQHLLRVSQERNQPPVLVEVNRLYGARLDADARLKWLRYADGKVAELTIRPLVTGVGRDLAHEIGAFVWRAAAEPGLAGVVVVCEDPLGGGGDRFAIPAPATIRPAQPSHPAAAPRGTRTQLAPEKGTPPAAAGAAAPGPRGS